MEEGEGGDERRGVRRQRNGIGGDTTWPMPSATVKDDKTRPN